MPRQGNLEGLINSELRKLHSRLTDVGDPKETAVMTMCLGKFSHELFTHLIASNNTTIAYGQAFFSQLADTVGAHPHVPANDFGPQRLEGRELR